MTVRTGAKSRRAPATLIRILTGEEDFFSPEKPPDDVDRLPQPNKRLIEADALAL